MSLIKVVLLSSPWSWLHTRPPSKPRIPNHANKHTTQREREQRPGEQHDKREMTRVRDAYSFSHVSSCVFVAMALASRTQLHWDPRGLLAFASRLQNPRHCTIRGHRDTETRRFPLPIREREVDPHRERTFGNTIRHTQTQHKWNGTTVRQSVQFNTNHRRRIYDESLYN